jgi:hypothetical protein
MGWYAGIADDFSAELYDERAGVEQDSVKQQDLYGLRDCGGGIDNRGGHTTGHFSHETAKGWEHCLIVSTYCVLGE